MRARSSMMRATRGCSVKPAGGWVSVRASAAMRARSTAVTTDSDQSASMCRLQSTVNLLPLVPAKARACGRSSSRPRR
jgi:hypothetical protein